MKFTIKQQQKLDNIKHQQILAVKKRDSYRAQADKYQELVDRATKAYIQYEGRLIRAKQARCPHKNKIRLSRIRYCQCHDGETLHWNRCKDCGLDLGSCD